MHNSKAFHCTMTLLPLKRKDVFHEQQFNRKVINYIFFNYISRNAAKIVSIIPTNS